MPISPEQFSVLKTRYKSKRDEMDVEWKNHWIDLANYILPRHSRFVDKATIAGQGDKSKHRYIINGTATRAISIAVSGLKGGLVPHSLPWFKLGLWDEDLGAYGPAKEWLHKVGQIMYAVFTKSNFYSSVHTPFTEQIVFGTGPFAVYKDKKTLIHCTPWTVGEYVLMTDDTGRVDTGFRWMWMTIRQMVQHFGLKNLSESSKKMANNGNQDRSVVVINAVYPRKDHDPSKDGADNLPWASVWWEENANNGEMLLESGFRTQAVMFPRWEVVGEDAYGSNCPGMEMIGDIKMLQKLEQDKLASIALVNNPPMNVPTMFKGRLSLLPGARNYMDAGDAERVRQTIEARPDIGAIANEIARVEMRIKEGFFNDLFLMILNDKNMTATEVARRHEEKLAILGPVIEKQNSEFLSPLIDRVFDVLMEEGMIPEPPRELQGKEIRVDYISLLAQAQKAVGTGAIEKTLGLVTAAAQLNPEVVDKLDFDAMIEEHGDLVGLKPKIIRSKDEVGQIREGRQQAQAAAQQQEQALAMSQTAKNLGQTPLDDESALGGLLSQVPAP